MKKITLLFILCITTISLSYGQCTTNTGGQWPTGIVNVSNSGGVETISTNNWPNAEFSILDGIVGGNDYTVTATAGIAASVYITVTNTAGGAVLVHGADSVSFTAPAGATSLTIFWHLDAACATAANDNTTTTIQCTSCICTETVAPGCVTEIAPVDGDLSVAFEPGGGITFSWNTDPLATDYELFINGFSQGVRSPGITFTGLNAGESFTWSVVPFNCFGAAMGCDTWDFTTEACTALVSPNITISPSPSIGENGVAISGPDGGVTFSWAGGDGPNPAESFTLNFGTSDPPGQAFPNFPSGGGLIGLDVNVTYFWSVDAVNCAGTTTGTVWSFTTDTTLGTENVEIVEGFKLYPNPTSGILNIKSTLEVDNVVVSNLLGQQVASFNKNSISNNSVNLSELSQGLYMVTITAGDKTETFKINKK